MSEQEHRSPSKPLAKIRKTLGLSSKSTAKSTEETPTTDTRKQACLSHTAAEYHYSSVPTTTTQFSLSGNPEFYPHTSTRNEEQHINEEFEEEHFDEEIEEQQIDDKFEEENYVEETLHRESQNEPIYANLDYFKMAELDQLRATVAALSAVAQTAIKPAQFKPSNAEGWFANLEAQFQLSHIHDAIAKFKMVVANIPADYLQPVSHIAYKSAIVEEDYENLKKELISIHRESKMKRMSQLLDTAEMGDQTPSQFYRFLKSRFSATEMQVPKDILYNRWLQKLPTAIQVPIAAAAQKMEEKDWLQLADSVYEINGGNNYKIAAVSNGFRSRSNSVSSNSSYRSNYSQRSRNSNSRRRSKFDPNGANCWYHWKFGAKARKCSGDDCKFKKSKNASQ